MQRRQFNTAMTTTLHSSLPLQAMASPAEDYESAIANTWRIGPLQGLQGAALSEELVRYATLAPSSHNTQCWRFALEPRVITILPDLRRRCPVVDPDDHHLFVSLGCAAENLVQAAHAFGLYGEVSFDRASDSVRIALQPTVARSTASFLAMAQRQSTRGVYDGKALPTQELKLLEAAGNSPRVRMVLLEERAALAHLLELVIQGNTTQLDDKAFVAELKQWIRFSSRQAVLRGDGLYVKSSGNPALPQWLGERMFEWVLSAKSENDKITQQLRSSAGVAVFVGNAADPAHRVDVGRAYERFALQAAALGVRTAHLNQPVEVAALRAPLARLLGAGSARPDLVIRFGHGPAMPPSLRRPVKSVIV
jgi:hypothetical protein